MEKETESLLIEQFSKLADPRILLKTRETLSKQNVPIDSWFNQPKRA